MSTVNREVTIKIDDSFTGPVCDYSVGFLKFRQQGKIEVADPMGSGTFVKLGKLYGILTAAHVLREFGLEETVGLVRFPSIRPALQNRRLNLGHTKRVLDWNGKDCDAPDIAFVSIPEVDGRELEAKGAIFYNLGLPRDFKIGTAGNRMSTCYALVGVVGEWTEDGVVAFIKGRKIDIGGLFGAAKTVRPFQEDGNDLVEIEVSFETGPRVPRSYGGVSGGALWELHVELDKDLVVVKVNKKLHGVAFRQSGDRKRVTANAASVVEAFVKDKVVAAWPEADTGQSETEAG
ncbi:hypothetical protein [Bradyrhizobium canariense]|uniref:Trypsin-like peptidase domain-containing protein n=1 Tax=Bradyrhizobium canariense TaxID=255045 RepID=A0A1H1XFU2_9BRAD|nr:hypothetical protein [Bradyrhizobium canariense]SDT08153.1 hypothetical protein SAMN05444158_4309 [Bradyrhizobium canariense]